MVQCNHPGGVLSLLCLGLGRSQYDYFAAATSQECSQPWCDD